MLTQWNFFVSFLFFYSVTKCDKFNWWIDFHRETCSYSHAIDFRIVFCNRLCASLVRNISATLPADGGSIC